MHSRESSSLFDQIESLIYHSSVLKHAHFTSSKSKESMTITLGIPVVAINVLIGSTFIKSFGENSENIISLLSLVAALLAGVQTYLSYQKKSMLHIEVGNLYSDIERECRILKGKLLDKIVDKDTGWEEIRNINNLYRESNRKAQDCPVTHSVIEKSKVTVKKISDELSDILKTNSPNPSR